MDGARLDTLARSLHERRSRRRTLAALLGGTLGSLALADDGEAANKKKRRRKRDNDKKSPPAPPPPPLPPGQPSASQNCLATGDQCGTFANLQGACRVPAAADAQAGLVCTSNQAGNPCESSNQCGANTRCAGLPTATCRVVIP
jgi:hypothetical protein